MMSILGLFAIVLLALISPGPDFAVVVKNSLLYSRKIGIFTALGVALSNIFHVSYILLGFGVLIASNFWIFWTVKFLGASYLIYIGSKGLMAKKSEVTQVSQEKSRELSVKKAILSGFLNSALNPKAMLFYLSIFSVLITKDTTKAQIISYGFMIFCEAFVWFTIVALCFSNSYMRNKFISVGHWIERITGTILIGLGVKLFFIKMK